MTELSIRPEDVRSAIEQYVTSYSAETTREEVGTVAEVGDGIARFEGLYSTMANELLEFGGGVLGLALNLDTREVGAVQVGAPKKYSWLLAHGLIVSIVWLYIEFVRLFARLRD